MNRNCFYFPNNFSMKFHFERSNFFNNKFVLFQIPTSLFQRKRIISSKFLESWISCFFSAFNSSKKTIKRLIQSFYNFPDKIETEFVCILERHLSILEAGRLAHIRSNFSSCICNNPSFFKAKIIQQTAKFKNGIGILFRLFTQICSEFICFSHWFPCYNYNIIFFTKVNCANSSPPKAGCLLGEEGIKTELPQSQIRSYPFICIFSHSVRAGLYISRIFFNLCF